jgi:hypothetical protein
VVIPPRQIQRSESFPRLTEELFSHAKLPESAAPPDEPPRSGIDGTGPGSSPGDTDRASTEP